MKRFIRLIFTMLILLSLLSVSVLATGEDAPAVGENLAMLEIFLSGYEEADTIGMMRYLPPNTAVNMMHMAIAASSVMRILRLETLFLSSLIVRVSFQQLTAVFRHVQQQSRKAENDRLVCAAP